MVRGRSITVGMPDMLYATTAEPGCEPVVVGVASRPIWQMPPGATAVGANWHVVVVVASSEYGPVKEATELIRIGMERLFVRVAVKVFFWLTTSVPNAIGFGLIATADTPLAVRFAICWLVGASSLRVSMLAATAPSEVGSTVTLTTQFLPGNTGVPTTHIVVPALME